MDDRFLNSMKLVKDYRSYIVEFTTRRGPLATVEAPSNEDPAEVDLRNRVCVGPDGEIDLQGGVLYHLRNGNHYDNVSEDAKGRAECDALISVEYDIIRKGTLDLIEEITGMNQVRIDSTKWVYVDGDPNGKVPEWLKSEVDKSAGKADVYFGLHCLLARATYGAITCGAPWPENPLEAIKFPYMESCLAHIDEEIAWQIATDAGTMWDILPPSMLLATAIAMGEHPIDLTRDFDEDRTSLLCNNMVSVLAMNFETLSSVLNHQLDGIHRLMRDHPSSAISDVNENLTSFRKTLTDILPSISAIAEAWQEVSCLVSGLEGFLVGGRDHVEIPGILTAIHEDCDAYEIGFSSGSTITVDGNQLMKSNLDDFRMLIVSITSAIVNKLS